MSIKSILFVRHGQSVANAGGVTMEHAAIPLSSLGVRQAHTLAALLPAKPACVFTSAYLRAQETAQPYCYLVGAKAEALPLLNEFSTIDPALLAGMNGEQRRPIADAFWKEADPCKRMGEKAETFTEFSQRVSDFVDGFDSIPDGSVLFGHGMMIGLMIWNLLGFNTIDSVGMKHFRRFQSGLPMPNGAVYHFDEVAPGRWQVRADEAIMREIMRVAAV